MKKPQSHMLGRMIDDPAWRDVMHSAVEDDDDAALQRIAANLATAGAVSSATIGAMQPGPLKAALKVSAGTSPGTWLSVLSTKPIVIALMVAGAALVGLRTMEGSSSSAENHTSKSPSKVLVESRTSLGGGTNNADEASTSPTDGSNVDSSASMDGPANLQNMPTKSGRAGLASPVQRPNPAKTARSPASLQRSATSRPTVGPPPPTQVRTSSDIPADTLAAELALLNPMRAFIATDPDRALELADEHALRFPDGRLAIERERLRERALEAARTRPESTQPWWLDR